eukprot:Awhi_evm2s15205
MNTNFNNIGVDANMNNFNLTSFKNGKRVQFNPHSELSEDYDIVYPPVKPAHGESLVYDNNLKSMVWGNPSTGVNPVDWSVPIHITAPGIDAFTVSGTTTLLGDLIVNQDVITTTGVISEGLLLTHPTLDINVKNNDILRLQNNGGQTIIGGNVIIADQTPSTDYLSGAPVIEGGLGKELAGDILLAGNPIDNFVEIKEKDVNTVIIQHTTNKNIEIDCFQLKLNAETDFVDNVGNVNCSIRPFTVGTYFDVKNDVPLNFQGIGGTPQSVVFSNAVITGDAWYINPDGTNNLQTSVALNRVFGPADPITDDLYLEKKLITDNITSTQNPELHEILLQSPPINYNNSQYQFSFKQYTKLIIHNNTNDIYLSLAPVNVFCDEFVTSKFKIDKDGHMYSHNIQGENYTFRK